MDDTRFGTWTAALGHDDGSRRSLLQAAVAAMAVTVPIAHGTAAQQGNGKQRQTKQCKKSKFRCGNRCISK
jgi:hypothetical protein